MNKYELESLLEGKAQPVLYRLAVTIAKHPLRWTAGAFVVGAALGWLV